jgi:predicted RNA-binding Zn-ribbon protein involved in translation (DUF1610 family)
MLSPDGTASIRSRGSPVVAKLVECASCGAFVEVSEAAADTDQHPEALEQAPELVRFYCPDCWSEGAG